MLNITIYILLRVAIYWDQNNTCYLFQELYSDQVEFCTRTDKFTVNVQAVLPRYSIDLPHSLGFETCGVQTTAIKTFTLVNKSIETYFKWSVAAPFSIEPALGLLPERGHCDVTVKFTPSEAHVYDSKAVVSFGNDQHKDFFISGVGERFEILPLFSFFDHPFLLSWVGLS